MEFYKILQEIMDEKNIGVADVARLCGLTDSTVRSIIDREQKKVALNVAFKLSDGLGVSLERLNGGAKKSPSLPDEALKVARDYNGLDTHGRSMTRMVISEEQKRMEEELTRRREKELILMDEELGEPVESRVIPLYLTAAAAGYTAPVFGEDFDYIEVGGDVPRHADFAVKIDGDSMEPYIMDGSTVYVNRDPLADGDVGIFCLDGDMLCKQYHKDALGVVRLLSLNRARADADRVVSDSSTLACFGRVILPHQLRVVI